ncbi:MAG: glycosyltransferase, partial [Deltaproteobacteria bacterium]|nr:glycosyltransferase [Deltaproteobacteria bacterium]
KYFKNLSNSLAYNQQIYLPRGLKEELRRIIKNFDLVHLHGHRNFLNNIVRIEALKNNIPYILSGHGTVVRIERKVFINSIFDKFFGNSVLRDASGFVAVSESELKQFEEMGVSPDEVRVIYNGIELDDYRDLPPKGEFKKNFGLEGKKVILYLGKFTPRKGMDFLTRAFARLKKNSRDDIKLVFVGNDMGFKSKVLEIIKEEGLSDSVVFTGLLTGRDKLAAYVDADVLAYPAVHEIFGLVPFEALMCGAPVVVTDDCGCGLIIEREGAGETVKYNDTRALADKLGKILSDGEEVSESVKKGQEFIEKNLSWEIIGKRYEEFYKEVLGKK